MSSIYDVCMTTTRAKLTSSGQLSLPAAIRHRWATGAVLVIDQGDYAIVRPVPADTVAALQGAYAGPGPGLDQARDEERRTSEAHDQRSQ